MFNNEVSIYLTSPLRYGVRGMCCFVHLHEPRCDPEGASCNPYFHPLQQIYLTHVLSCSYVGVNLDFQVYKVLGFVNIPKQFTSVISVFNLLILC